MRLGECSRKKKGKIMKKFIALIACCCCAAVFAGDVEIKDVINKGKIGDKKLPGWAMNVVKGRELGTAAIVQGSESDEKAFKITSGKDRTAFFSQKHYVAKAGDKVKVSAIVKGKGAFVFGFYIYNVRNQFLNASSNHKTVPVSSRAKEVEFEFVVPNGVKGDVTTHIRPYIAAGPRSEIIIEDLEIEIDHKDR